MNTYTKTKIIKREQQIAAFDENTKQIIPKEVLKFVVAEYLPRQTEVIEKEIHTFKMQPRYPSEEIKGCCRYYFGGCGVCMCRTAACSVAIPAVALHLAARAVVAVISAPFCVCMGIDEACSACCERKPLINIQSAFDVCCKHCLNECLGNSMSCSRIDYRLNRSYCVDCGDLFAQYCCFATMDDMDPSKPIFFVGPRQNPQSPLNGPKSMWME